MDSVVSQIAEFAGALQYTDLSPAVVHECKRRVVDTFGCGLGAIDAEPGRIARALALRVKAEPGAHVLGTPHRALPELAAFANCVMARYLDGNDTFPGGGHPSDVISPVVAMAEATGAGGRTAITAIALAYEVYYHLFQAFDMRPNGWDYVFYTAVASAVGAGKVLALDRKRLVEAVALAMTPNLALGATRRGELSMWKGCAGGNAARNGTFAALLAAEGMTGPEKPVEGGSGLREQLGKFEFTPFANDRRHFRISEANLKYFLAEYHSQGPISLALKLQPQVAVEDIESITIHTYWFTWNECGSEPEKWHPTTRETADHSLPYMIAAVLIDGRFSDEIFSEERLRDPRIFQLADKIAVKEDLEFSRRYPATLPCRIEIVTRSGQRKVAALDYPPGHYQNPMTDDEIDTKFCGLAGRVLPKKNVDAALELLWKLDEVTDLGVIFDAMVVKRA